MNMPVALTLAALFSTASTAQSMQGHDTHGHESQMTGMAMPSAAALHEPGQSEFAAIAEATRLLEADPATDWSKANIDALRQHLADMNNVTLQSDVTTTPIAGGARFDVTSAQPRVQQSINRMTHLHAGMANAEGLFKMSVQDIANGVSITAVGSNAADTAKIRGLGFFGLLTEGVHHQRHHLMLAKGRQMDH